MKRGDTRAYSTIFNKELFQNDMKMKKVVFSTLFYLLVLSVAADAQTYGSIPNIMTPEAATLGKFGSYPLSYYTGAVNVSVPLYTIKENDLSLDLTLQNIATGFIPNEEDGITGLNWDLMAGGLITRQVNWSPDDQNISYIGGDDNMKSNKGYIYGMLQAGLGTFTGDYIRTLGFLNLSNPAFPVSNLPYEYSPDVFSFNFNGHNGRFFLGNDGTVKVSSDRNYKVDLSGMSGQNDLCMCNPSTIIVTTDEGDIYTFGGDISALQITYPYQPANNRNIACGSGVINAWYLKSIQTHNGRAVTFNYEPQDKFELSNAGSDGQLDGVNPALDYVYDKIYKVDKYELIPAIGGEAGGSNAGQLPGYSLIKTVYLSSIVTPTTEIDFTYSQKAHEFYGSGEGYALHHNRPKQLDKIQIKDAAGNSIRNITMDYIAYGSSTVGYRNFLSKVNFKDAYDNAVFSYQFDYYNTSNLPSPLTKGIDLWGYYNGNDGNSELVPISSSGPPNFDVTFAGRDANSTLCDMGLLKRITFPTGGWSEFTYEGHDYSKVLRKTVQGGMTPSWFNENGHAGGARIKQITNSEGVTQSFFYKKDYDPNNPNAANLPSSGVLTDHNIFFLDCIFPDNQYPYTGTAQYALIQDNNIAASSSYGETPIGYSEVTELVSGNGYTKYFYSTQETNPDIYDQGANSYILTPSQDPSATNFNQQMKRLVKYSSCDMERGRLLKTAIYKNENGTSTLLREITNQYNTDPSRYDQSVIGFNFPFFTSNITAVWAIYHSYALYYFQNNITQTTTKDYFSNGKASTTTVNFSYISNSNPLLRSQSQINSKGEKKTVTNNYAFDLSGYPPYNTMVAKNMIGPVVEQLTYKNDVNFLSSTKTNYNYWSGASWDINNSAGLILPQNTQTKTLGQSSYATRFNYDSYDGSGNVTALSKANDVEHSYIWGYNKQYRIAEVVNATPDKVAYTSFEDNDLGGWTLNPGSVANIVPAFTGKMSFSGIIYKDLPQGNYVVTLWSKTGAATHDVNGSSGTPGLIEGQWQLYTYAVNNATHIAVTADNADEIRLYPVGAQMTTYTYAPAVGMTSRTDWNNYTTYYKFDAFGRLALVVDNDGSVLKKYCYNYAGQTEQCNFFWNSAISADYYSQSCPSGQMPNAYHVTVPEGMFTSTVDQPAADQLAQQYAQDQANAHGSCYIPNVSFYYDNEVGATFTIQLHNALSGQDYWISVTGHSDGTIDIPPGSYNIIITPQTSSGYFLYTVACGYYNEGPGSTVMTFYSVDLSSGCNTMEID